MGDGPGPSLTRNLLTESAEELDAQRRKDEEEQKEEESEVADLGQRLHHRVQQRPDSLGHLQQLQH